MSKRLLRRRTSRRWNCFTTPAARSKRHTTRPSFTSDCTARDTAAARSIHPVGYRTRGTPCDTKQSNPENLISVSEKVVWKHLIEAPSETSPTSLNTIGGKKSTSGCCQGISGGLRQSSATAVDSGCIGLTANHQQASDVHSRRIQNPSFRLPASI